MPAITDFTNKWFCTSNRVHKMFHETTISLHSLMLDWITILLLTEITAFVFNVAIWFIFVTGTPRSMEEMGDGMPLSHTLYSKWHGLGAHLALWERWWCSPKKNHQDGWLSLYSTAEPFCLAESIPKAHWAHKTLGRGVMCMRCTDSSDMYCFWLDVNNEVNVTDCFFQVLRLEKAIQRSNLNGRWRKEDIPPPLTLSLNLHPVLVCQALSQIVTLNMAVNSQWVA